MTQMLQFFLEELKGLTRNLEGRLSNNSFCMRKRTKQFIKKEPLEIAFNNTANISFTRGSQA